MNFPPDEEWLELDVDPSYLVSTHGRLYDARTRSFVFPKLITPTSGTPSWTWDIRESRPEKRASTRKLWAGATVLRHFVGSGRIVVYKDGNIRNLRLDNLEWRYSTEKVGGAEAMVGSTVGSG